jgi:hypothetical protein
MCSVQVLWFFSCRTHASWFKNMLHTVLLFDTLCLCTLSTEILSRHQTVSEILVCSIFRFLYFHARILASSITQIESACSSYAQVIRSMQLYSSTCVIRLGSVAMTVILKTELCSFHRILLACFLSQFPENPFCSDVNYKSLKRAVLFSL